MIGIYAIHCLTTDRKYIGGSSDIENRWTVHKSILRLNTHHCVELQKAFLLYGEENFVYSVLEQVSKKSYLRKREQYWLDRHPDSYNTKKRADGKGSLNLTEEQQIQWSEKAKARCTPEWKEEVSKRVTEQSASGNFGAATWTEESRKKQSEALSKALKGRVLRPSKPISEESRQRYKLAALKREAAKRERFN